MGTRGTNKERETFPDTASWGRSREEDPCLRAGRTRAPLARCPQELTRALQTCQRRRSELPETVL